MGFPQGYLEPERVALDEDVRCGLAGDPFPVKVFARLLQGLEGLGARWPVLPLRVHEGNIAAVDVDLGEPVEDEELQVEGPVGEQAPLLIWLYSGPQYLGSLFCG